MTTIDSMDSNRIYFVSVVVFAFKIACEGEVLEGKRVCIPIIMKEKINIKNCSKSLNKKVGRTQIIPMVFFLILWYMDDYLRCL